MKLTRIGLDLAKNVFQVHGVDRSEEGAASATVPGSGGGIFRETCAVFDWHGGMRERSLLGSCFFSG